MGDDHAKGQLPAGFCVLPWINLHVATTGAISPCCEFGGEVANLSASTLSEAWASDDLAAIRKAFVDGVALDACRKCFDRERSEGASLRLQSNRKFARWAEAIAAADTPLDAAPDHPAAFDLRFSNLCNFKCRSCWHGASSKWYTDGKAIGVTLSDRAEISSFDGVDDFLAQVGPGLVQVEDIYFAGGEPLMMPEHYALLERLIALGRTDVRISYNSNMSRTTFRGQSVFELWKHFPHIDLTASVDAAGTLGEMVRSGFRWETFVSNVGSVREEVPHVGLTFGITVSVFNIFGLPDLLDALARECDASYGEFFLHSLQDPPQYRTQILPASLKQRVSENIAEFMSHMDADDPGHDRLSDQLSGIIRYMDADDLSHLLPKFARVSGKLDALRREETAEYLPELAPYLAASGRHTALGKKLVRLFRSIGR